MARRTKPLREFHGITHEDLFGVLSVLLGRRQSSGLTQQEVAEKMGV